MTEKESINELYQHIAELKKLKRTGWTHNGIENPESVADHSFGVIVIALFMGQGKGLDMEKVLKTAIIHDLGESLIGDITPKENVQDKSFQEASALKMIVDSFSDRDELLELWKDFEYKRTPEGRFVKNLDKLEMALQAKFYQEETGIDLGEFVESARLAVDEAGIRDLI